MSKSAKERAKKKFASAIVEGKSQTAAYKEAFPNASDVTAKGNSSRYANKPSTIAHINKALANIREKDASDIIRGCVEQAKGAKKTVFVGKDRHKVEDNQATIASREQFFKLAGVQGFGTTVNIDNRKVTVNVGADEAQHVTDAMSKLLAMKRELDTDETDSDSLITIDVESTTSDDESTPSYEDS